MAPAPALRLRPMRAVAEERLQRWLPPGAAVLEAHPAGPGGEAVLLDRLFRLLGSAAGPGAAWLGIVEGGRDELRYAADLAAGEGLTSERLPGRRRLAGPVANAAPLRALLETGGGTRCLTAALVGPAAALEGCRAALGRDDPAAAVAALTAAGGLAVLCSPGSRAVTLVGAASTLTGLSSVAGAATASAAVEGETGEPGPERSNGGGGRRLAVAGAALLAVLVGLLGLELTRGHPGPAATVPHPGPSRVAPVESALPQPALQVSLLAGPAPPPRQRTAAAWDPRRGELLLFGGSSVSPSPSDLGDTWSWSPTGGWSERRPPQAPPARYGAVLAPYEGGMLLYGGGSRSPQPHALDDSWFWDGESWTHVLDQGKPQAGLPVALVAAPGGADVLVFRDPQGVTRTATLSPDRGWRTQAAPSPSGLVLVSPDPAEGSVYGISVATGEIAARAHTWRLRGDSWVSAGAPNEPEVDVITANLTFLEGGGLLLVEVDFLGDEGGVGGTWTFGRGGWQRHPGPIPAFVRSFDAVPSLFAQSGGAPVLLGGGSGADAFRRGARWDGRRWHDLGGAPG